MAFPAQRPRRVRIEFTPDGTSYRLAVRSAGPEGTWIEHAQAVVAALDPAENEPKWVQPPTLAQAFTPAESPSGPQSEAVSFGPRWRNIQSVCLGEHGAEAKIELPALYAGDLSVFQAHPALMDMATTFGLYLVGKAAERDTVYVPMSAERVRLYRPLPPRFRSQVQLVSHQPGSVVAFDVILTDEGGGLLASCKNFSMRAVTRLGMPEKLGRQSLPEILLSKGIRTAEAPELFARVLTGAQREIVVSSLPLADLRRVMAETKVKEPATPRAGGSDKPNYGNAVESALAGIWSDLLGVDPVQPGDDFFALGGHSLAAVRLFAKVRKQFNVDLPLATLFQAPTLKELAFTVAEKGGITLVPFSVNAASLVPATPLDSSHNAAVTVPTRAEWSPLVPICRGQPDRLPLYCVHGGGGNVLNLKALSDKLGRDQPFYGLQAQGVDGRLPPLDSIEAMAASYLAAIRAVDPDGPLCLAGYSGGGVVAFEMAQQLASQGRTIPFLLLFDTLAPHAATRPMPLVEKIWSARRWSMRYALDWPRRLRQRRLTADRRRQVRAWIERNETVPHEFLDVYLMDAYLEAQRRYQTRAYAGSMTLLRAREAATDYIRAGPKLGWETFIQGGIEIYEVNSDHLTMLEKPAIDEVAAIVKARMEALHASVSASPDERASLCLPG
jgi:thioesterase domain-containing protein/acyl carrier protein